MSPTHNTEDGTATTDHVALPPSPGERTPAGHPPAEEYETRCESRWEAAQRFRHWSRRLIVVKRGYLGSFIGYAVFDPTVAAVLVPVAISLIPMVMLQHWLVTRWHRYRQSALFYERALDRLDGQWLGRGDAGWRYDDEDHPYARDLDLFGHGSLFQLLCTPLTATGRDTLAAWLKTPADAATVCARQAAVRELQEDVDLREAFVRAGAAAPQVPTATLEAAATATAILSHSAARFIVPLLAWLWVIALVMDLREGGLWGTAFLVGLAIQTVVYLLLRGRIRVLASRGHEVGMSLVAVAVFVEVVKRHPGRSALLRQLSATICEPPAALHKNTAWVAGFIAQLPVLHFIVVQLVPQWETRLLQRINRLPAVFAAIGQYETLCALAAQAFEHPTDCLPEIVEPGPCFIADDLGHPLIPERTSVRNDVRLDEAVQMLMVSGSNMSGKSTLLRTVGINATLALAGAPVRARSARISPLAIGTAMRFRDSLESGTSYFYSVLTRLRTVLDLLAGSTPLLFLLDEILQGTNSHDRLVGAEAVIRKLIAQKAIGLVTTHDLELTRVADHLAPAAMNVHFADDVIDGKLSFDYRVRPGVVQSSNALTLMRDMGLDV